jgi:predicted ATPase
MATETSTELHGIGSLPELSAREDYQQQLQLAEAEISKLKAQHVQLVWVRTVCFLVAGGALFLGYGGDLYRTALQVVGWLFAVAFFVAITIHEHLRLQMEMHTSNADLFERLLARLDRNWDRLPAQRLLPEFSDLACADDLDVAGQASLLNLLSLAGTLPGKRALQSWLAQAPAWSQVTQRQRAVQKLAPCRDLRLSIVKTVLASSDGTEDVYGLPKWGASPAWLPQHRLAHVLSYAGPVCVGLGIALLLVAVFVTSAWMVNVAAGLLGLGFLINILLTVIWGSWIHEIFAQVTGQHLAAHRFADCFASFSKLPRDEGLLDHIRNVATEHPNCAKTGFGQLLWLVRLANLQRDPTLYVVYLVLQLSLCWDFRVLKSLEKWKHRFGAHIEEWFDGLGTCEALISSATLADEYRQWAFPQAITSNEYQLQSVAVGHPLLSDEARVLNDLTLYSNQPLLLVTGSNMAGKSTFMRALGLNLLLARTGSPVCAQAFSTHLYELATSIRVRDSLRDGVSFFMAELRRLKEVVDMAQRHASHLTQGARVQNGQSRREDNPIFFLLDEVLQGTNSRERQIAVATVLERLLAEGACGLLSTHDLDLATVDEIKRVAQIVHFREYFENVNGTEAMRFDYKMRPGPTPTTNALKLLKLVGLHSQSS